MPLLDQARIPLVCIALEEGGSLEELRSKSDWKGYRLRAEMLEEFFQHFYPLMSEAWTATFNDPSASARKDAIHRLSVNLGLTGERDFATQKRHVVGLLLYVEELLARAPEELQAWGRGDLAASDFPPEPMREAAIASAQRLGDSTEPSAMRQRLKRACKTTSWAVPIPRDNTP